MAGLVLFADRDNAELFLLKHRSVGSVRTTKNHVWMVFDQG